MARDAPMPVLDPTAVEEASGTNVDIPDKSALVVRSKDQVTTNGLKSNGAEERMVNGQDGDSPSKRGLGHIKKPSIAPLPKRFCMFVPPTNFGCVEPGAIYRSGYPCEANYDFMDNLNLKTILTLVPEPLSEEYTTFIHDRNIRHCQIHIPANKDGIVKITPERMAMALAVILDRSNHPMLVHCNRGKHRTGCVTACFRKVQTSTVEKAISEYRDYAAPKCRPDDITFIGSFNAAGLVPYARSHGWPTTPPPESTDSLALQLSAFDFTFEDMAALKVPEEPDQSL